MFTSITYTHTHTHAYLHTQCHSIIKVLMNEIVRIILLWIYFLKKKNQQNTSTVSAVNQVQEIWWISFQNNYGLFITFNFCLVSNILHQTENEREKKNENIHQENIIYKWKLNIHINDKSGFSSFLHSSYRRLYPKTKPKNRFTECFNQNHFFVAFSVTIILNEKKKNKIRVFFYHIRLFCFY